MEEIEKPVVLKDENSNCVTNDENLEVECLTGSNLLICLRLQAKQSKS